MHQEIKKMIDELRCEAAGQTGEWGGGCSDLLGRAASVLQSVFDPENQPSQYGTTLLPK